MYVVAKIIAREHVLTSSLLLASALYPANASIRTFHSTDVFAAIWRYREQDTFANFNSVHVHASNEGFSVIFVCESVSVSATVLGLY